MTEKYFDPGRRGFDPRLPLFPFNNLGATRHGVTAKLPHSAISQLISADSSC